MYDKIKRLACNEVITWLLKFVLSLDSDSLLVKILLKITNQFVNIAAKWCHTLGAIETLFVPDPYRSLSKNDAPSQFLRAEHQIVDFHGRGKELEELINWALCKDKTFHGKNISVALITGDPGRGKSRLARYLCELAEDWDDGAWIAKFLSENPKHENSESFRLLVAWPKSLLLVIDYAERRVAQIKEFVEVGLAKKDNDYPMRILLIARAKDEWLSNLDSAFASHLDNPFESNRVKWLQLDRLESDPVVGDRYQEFKHALIAFQKALGRRKIEILDNIPEDLSQAKEVEALDIHIEALLTAYGKNDDGNMVQTGSYEKRLLDSLVRREQQAWDQIIEVEGLANQGLKGKTIRRVVAWLATTDGLIDEPSAIQRLLLLPEFQSVPRVLLFGIARVVRTLYPSSDEEWWGGVGPDRLTTWLTRELTDVISVPAILAALPNNALVNLLRHSTWYAQRYDDLQALTTTIRAGGRRAIIAVTRLGAEVGDPVGAVAAKILEETKDVSVARAIHDHVGAFTVSLRELVLVATKILYDNAVSDVERAGYANNLGNRLADLGRREEALETMKEAVAVWRRRETQSDVFRFNLALSLNNLSSYLLDLGKVEKASEASEESVAIWRVLPEAKSDENLSGLVKSLNSYSQCLSILGSHERALEVIEEAVSISCRLAGNLSDAFRSDRAASLNNFSNCLRALGRRKEALEAVKKAVVIRRELAEIQPDAFRPELAASLNNLSNLLSSFEQYKEALDTCEEALAIRCKLAEVRPEVFRPDLATSFNNLSNRLSELGRYEEALRAVKKAITIRRELVKAHPDVFYPELAGSINNLGALLYDCRRYEEALENIEEAITIRRRLVAENQPDAFCPDLATSLYVKGRILLQKHDRSAIDIFREGIIILTDLFLATPMAHLGNMANLVRHYYFAYDIFGDKLEFPVLKPIKEKFKELEMELDILDWRPRQDSNLRPTD